MSGSNAFANRRARVPHLSTGQSGLAGEVNDLRNDVSQVVNNLGYFTLDEWIDPVAAGATAIKTAAATIAAITTYVAANFDGSVGAAVMSPARNITVTTAGATPADAPATALITGIDINNAVISETITVAQTATVATGVKCFKKITSITLPAADGVAATLSFGIGNAMGLELPAKIRSTGGSAFVATLRELVDGAVPGTAGTFTSSATDAPNGSYTPHSSVTQNAARDYYIVYEAAAPTGP